MSEVILPGSAIGVLGSGQLGRMFAIAARRMGYRVHTLSPDEDTPTGQVADLEVTANYDDLDAVRRFARDVAAVTFEFENVPADTAAAAAHFAPVRPNGRVLHITQHRLREKTYLSQSGFPVAPYWLIKNIEQLRLAVAECGVPCILKSAGFGYDGKGQFRIASQAQCEEAWEAVGAQEAVLEQKIEFACEISVVAARTGDGQFVHYGAVENQHVNGILDRTIAPARIAPEIASEAARVARNVLEHLEVVGVLCVEFFVTSDGKLIINELAPRPHNSGHFTFDANVTSQFEQQLRAVCGLPLGSTEQMRPAVMLNLLGDIWENGEPDWAAAAAVPNVKIHLYGKSDPRPGRKMGHLTALGDTVDEALNAATHARHVLTSSSR